MSDSGNKTQDILNAYVDGVMTERERIIKLLEEHLECRHAFDGTADACPHIDGKLFIALIEGENKQEYPQALPLPPKTAENTQPNWTGF